MKPRSVTLPAIVLALLLAAGGAGFVEPRLSLPGVAAAADVVEIALANGFRLLIVEDHRVPRVAASIWYRVGSAAEAPTEHGMVHFLEHMVHQGTTSVGTTNFDAEKPLLRDIYETEQRLLKQVAADRKRLRERNVFYDELAWPTTPEIDVLRKRLYELEDKDSQYREFWAEYNWYHRYGFRGRHTDPVPATTSKEQIEIDIDLPAEAIELFFRLEADRMVNAVFRGWEAQRFTLLEQRLNRQGRRATRFDYEALESLTGPAHPANHPSGGHIRDFVSFNRERMLRIYDTYFVPNNATLALVGDITPAQARSLAERYFGRISRGDEPPPRMDLESEPPPGGSIRLDWVEPLSSRVLVRYRIPAVGHPDRPAFDVMALVLKETLKKQLGGVGGVATSVDVSAQRRGSPAALTLDVSSRRDEDLSRIETVMLTAVDDLRQKRVDAAALARARKTLRLQWKEIRADRGSLAFELGSFEVMDSWTTLAPYMAAHERASAEDLQRLAAQYLVAGNQIIGTTRRNPQPAASERKATRASSD
jgi:predicted Zn-dependent peptidase